MNNPPITQIVLTTSFEPALDNLSIIDIADLYARYREDYPFFAQIHRAGAMSYVPFAGQQTVKGSMPRVVFGTEDTSHQVAFQSDRLTVLWNRTTPIDVDPKYPGFEEMLSRYFGMLEVLRKWIAERGLPEISPAVGEIAYVDAFGIEDANGNTRPIADLVTIINPDLRFPMIQGAFGWYEPAPAGLEGYVQVEIAAPNLLADGTPTLGLDTTITFAPGSTWDVVATNFRAAHEGALSVFERLVKRDHVAISG